MDKKPYVAPQCLVEELGTVSVIAASFEVLAGSNDVVNEMGSNQRRGEWGNLWSGNLW